MIHFFTDLDNTIIYSYRREIGQDKVLVEEMDGRELSYMTRTSHQKLEMLSKKCNIIPLTTRSKKQFERIHLGDNTKIPYALMSNGGILWNHGSFDEEWFAKSKELIADAEGELERAMEILKGDAHLTYEIRKVDDLFVFTKSEKPEETIERLKESLDEDKVYIDSNGVKILVFPRILNKGDAMLRLKKWLEEKGEKDIVTVAAGDSKFDVPMIRKADYGFCPPNLEQEFNDCSHVKTLHGKVFSDELLNEVNKLEW